MSEHVTGTELADGVSDGSSDVPPEETAMVTAEASRGAQFLRQVALLAVAVLVLVELSSPLCSGYSLGALESAFDSRPKSGLTLESARGHLVGLAMVSYREETTKMPKAEENRPVHFAVFTWPSLFRDHTFEIEIERVSIKTAGGGSGEAILMRSQPYIRVESNYKVVKPYAKPDPPLMQLMMLDHELDSIGTHRVERWQVERAIKKKKAEPSLLVYFDKNDKNKDGVVTAGELGQPTGIGNPEGAAAGKRAGGR
jgi:hypothetical protein